MLLTIRLHGLLSVVGVVGVVGYFARGRGVGREWLVYILSTTP